MPRATTSLPPLDSVTLPKLLSFHAVQLRRHLGEAEQPVRKRARVKVALPQDRLLHSVSECPERRAAAPCRSWQDRRGAGNFASAILSKYYGLPQKAARTKIKQLWPDITIDVKDNFFALKEMFGMPDVSEEHLLSLRVDSEVGPGAMLTWQTEYGRPEQPMRKLFEVDANPNDIVEIAQSDPGMQESFQRFADWISEQVELHELHCWSAAMELNSIGAPEARVHLHAYVCNHWKHWKTPRFKRVQFESSQWIWCGYAPHVAVAKHRNNNNPHKLFVAGLYYLQSPKVGSIYRGGNLRLYKASHPTFVGWGRSVEGIGDIIQSSHLQRCCFRVACVV